MGWLGNFHWISFQPKLGKLKLGNFLTSSLMSLVSVVPLLLFFCCRYEGSSSCFFLLMDWVSCNDVETKRQLVCGLDKVQTHFEELKLVPMYRLVKTMLGFLKLFAEWTCDTQKKKKHDTKSIKCSLHTHSSPYA